MAKFFTVLMVWLIVTLNAAAEDTIRFQMADYPPYGYQDEGRNLGIGYEAVAAIMADIKQPFTVQFVPHFGRSILELQQGIADGFFLATESVERNKVAEFSEPVFMVQWTWVWLKQRTDLVPGSNSFKLRTQVAAQTNSNIYHWLRENNYKVMAGTTDIRGLLNLLRFKRVDAILLPELTVKTMIEQQGTGLELYSFQKLVNLPFGIYINKAYLKHHPLLMQQLNTAIHRYHARIDDVQPD